MSRFINLTGKEISVNEGWGFALSMFLPGYNLANIAKTAKFNKVFKHPTFIKYVNSEGNRLLNELRKEDPKAKPAKNLANKSNMKASLSGDSVKDALGHHRVSAKCGNYLVMIYADTEHIQKAKIPFINGNGDVVYKTMKAPSSKDLHELGYKEE